MRREKKSVREAGRRDTCVGNVCRISAFTVLLLNDANSIPPLPLTFVGNSAREHDGVSELN